LTTFNENNSAAFKRSVSANVMGQRNKPLTE